MCSLGIVHLSCPVSFINFREYHDDRFRLDSSVKWRDPGHFLKSQGNFFCHFHVPFFYIFLTSKITNETLKSFLGCSILHYYDNVRRFYFLENFYFAFFKSSEYFLVS